MGMGTVHGGDTVAKMKQFFEIISLINEFHYKSSPGKKNICVIICVIEKVDLRIGADVPIFATSVTIDHSYLHL